MLRAGVVTAVTIFGFALWKILSSGSKPLQTEGMPDESQSVRNALANAKNSSANIALLGDKRFLWSADRQAFIIYQICGDSWIALGDPVGPAEQQEALVWAFCELADRHNGKTVFYQVTDKFLSLYVDGVIVAFANLWSAPAGGELSIDLMRFDQHAPKGVMDFLLYRVDVVVHGT